MHKSEVYGKEGGVPPIYIEWREKRHGKLVSTYRAYTDKNGVIHRFGWGKLFARTSV